MSMRMTDACPRLSDRPRRATDSWQTGIDEEDLAGRVRQRARSADRLRRRSRTPSAPMGCAKRVALAHGLRTSLTEPAGNDKLSAPRTPEGFRRFQLGVSSMREWARLLVGLVLAAAVVLLARRA